MFTINTIEKAYEATGRTPFQMPAIPGLADADLKYMKDQFDWTVCIEAINKEANNGEKWIPDFENKNERKYEILVCLHLPVQSEDNALGWVFSYTGTRYACTCTGVGSWLCFKTHEAALYCLETFSDLFKAVHLVKK